MSTLILTGPTWYAADGTAHTGDVLVRDGVVAQVGTVDAPNDAERVDAEQDERFGGRPEDYDDEPDRGDRVTRGDTRTAGGVEEEQRDRSMRHG